MYKFLIYLIFPILTLIVGILARDIPVPEGTADSAITRQLQRISIFLYRLAFKKKQIPGAEQVRSSLSTLYGGKDTKKLEEDYYAGKISTAILMALAGSFLALMLSVSSLHDAKIEDGGVIHRLSPGDGDQTFELLAKDTKGKELGSYEFVVDERYYTPEEADRLFEEASAVMEKTVLGDNESFDKVCCDLSFVSQLEGYPFEISWKTDNYDIIGHDGKIKSEEIPDDGCPVELNATYKYDDRSWQQVLFINVVPKKLSGEERIRAAIEGLLKDADKASKYEEQVVLPESYRDGDIVWSRKKDDSSLILMILMLFAGGLCFVLKDKELQKKIDERNAQMLLDYPRFVSQIVLYLGAGMTLRTVFAKLSEEYLGKKEKGAKARFMYEELVRSTREMGTGKSEAEILESFGKRCSGQEYARLCALLSQNQKKGNSELLRLLQEESSKAFENRMNLVRKRGEEAGTKLLLPMTLMLLIVMVVIMIPAYMTF